MSNTSQTVRIFNMLDTKLQILDTIYMADTSNVLGGVIETFKEEGKKVAKEVATEIVKTPVNILEGLAPVNPQEVQAKSMEFKQEKQAKLAKIRSELGSQIQTAPKQKEDRRIFQGAETAERGMINTNASMNSGGQQLSASMTPKKKPEPLVVQQKRNNKLHGAG